MIGVEVVGVVVEVFYGLFGVVGINDEYLFEGGDIIDLFGKFVVWDSVLIVDFCIYDYIGICYIVGKVVKLFLVVIVES